MTRCAASSLKSQMLHDELAAAAGVTAPVPTPPSIASAPATPPAFKSAWDLAKDVDIEKVSDWLGLGTGSAMVCPGCSATSGYGRVPGANITKCHHNSCSAKGNPKKPGSRTTVDLVVESKKVPPKDAVNLLSAQFGFAPLVAKTSKKKPAPAPPPNATGASWEAGLLVDDSGRTSSTGANAELIFANDPVCREGRPRVQRAAQRPVFSGGTSGRVPAPQRRRCLRHDDDVACCHWLARTWRVFITEACPRG